MAEWADQIVRMMRESVNASIETAVKFQEQTWRMIDELIQRGAVAKEEGQRLLDMWTRRTEDFQARMEEKYRQWEESISRGFRGALPPTRRELEELHRKLDQLMMNLEAVPGKAKGGRGGKKARKPKAKPAAKRK